MNEIQARKRPKNIFIAFILIIAVGAYIGFQKFKNSKAAKGQDTIEAPLTELEIKTMTTGEGSEAIKGNKLVVHYTGWLANGTKFDSTVDRNVPQKFVLGLGQVIPGWDQGLMGMRVGEKRRLRIPSKLAYGTGGAGKLVPPNSDLTYEIELLKIE